jgi:phosphate/sulfate permease
MSQPSNTSPITSQFGARTTALQAVQGISLKGRNAMVTGGASGLGLETSRALLAAGAALTLAVRNLEQGRAAAVDGEPGAAASSINIK